MRCARRRKGAAYQHYRRRSVSGRHAVIMPSASYASPTLSGHVPHALDCKAAAESSSDRASFSVNGSESAIGKRLYRQRDVMRTPKPEEFRGLHPRRASRRHSIFGSKLPKFGVRFLVGQPEPFPKIPQTTPWRPTPTKPTCGVVELRDGQ